MYWWWTAVPAQVYKIHSSSTQYDYILQTRINLNTFSRQLSLFYLNWTPMISLNLFFPKLEDKENVSICHFRKTQFQPFSFFNSKHFFLCPKKPVNSTKLDWSVPHEHILCCSQMVPQGCVLGPILYSLSTHHCCKWADDTTIAALITNGMRRQTGMWFSHCLCGDKEMTWYLV